MLPSEEEAVVSYQPPDPTSPHLNLEDRAAVIISGIFDFISLHLDMRDGSLSDKGIPTTWAELREQMLESGANFGTPPPPEVYNSPDYVHEPYVPESFYDFRDTVLITYDKLTDEHFDYEMSTEIKLAVEELFPSTIEEFIAYLRTSAFARVRGVVFALEHLSGRGGARQVSGPGMEDTIDGILEALIGEINGTNKE